MFAKKIKPYIIPLVAIALIGIALSFSPIRSLASELLNVFRVEKIETINITKDDIERLQALDNPAGGKIDIEGLGEIEASGYKEPKQVSQEEAKTAVDFDLKLPNELEGYSSPTFVLHEGFTNSFKLDVEKVNQLIKSFGGTKFLPPELDDKKFSVNMPDTIVANYQSDNNKSFMIAQARSPKIIMPEGIDEEVVRDVLLNLPVLPENIRKQIAAIKDWRRTLIVPNIDGSTQEVQVQGVQGVFISPPQQETNQASDGTLIWQKDGIVYALSGRLNLNEALKITELMD